MPYFQVVKRAEDGDWDVIGMLTDDPNLAMNALKQPSAAGLLAGPTPNNVASQLSILKMGQPVKGFLVAEGISYLETFLSRPEDAGPGGDHNTPFVFTLPHDQNQVRDWLKLNRKWYGSEEETR